MMISSTPTVAPQPPIAPSPPSYYTAISYAHSQDVAAKMTTIYAAKGKWAAFHEILNLAKHVRFTYSDDEEDEVEKDLEEDLTKPRLLF
ncbi:hypothetical protein DVH24_042382 [Malus domestica]|uniref:Uncharacterized protein n=1 Tax=Malus domestica TaxID=3750 RepID=A0A498J4C2_MALDO|nr:hypothetical protein DVH24_042382 [Malus domestica]